MIPQQLKQDFSTRSNSPFLVQLFYTILIPFRFHLPLPNLQPLLTSSTASGRLAICWLSSFVKRREPDSKRTAAETPSALQIFRKENKKEGKGPL